MDSKVTPPEVDPPTPDEEEEDLDEAMPRMQVTRRSLLLFVLPIVSILAFLIVVLPQIAGLHDTWDKIQDGNPWWLVVCLLCTMGSFGGYVMLFEGVFGRVLPRIDFRASYQITMSGLAASRLFAGGGAGGIALTAWALRRAGMSRRQVADKTLAFLCLTYVVYMAALFFVGLGLYAGILPGPQPFAITVIPAIFATVATSIALLISRVPPDLQRRLDGFAKRGGRLGRLTRALAAAPAAFSAGIREALRHVRSRDPALAGSIIYWASNIGILWAAFHAFGDPPPWSVIVMAYFVGFFGNLLPLPAGIGGLDGGMIGAFAAFGVDTSTTLVAVLTYRAFAIELPTIPGAIAYIQLRRTVSRWREERAAMKLAAPASA